MLDQELATLEAYFGIEASRFGERLLVVIQCPAELGDALLPGFLLQPLVENAIRYGVAPSRRTVTLRITASATPTELILTVEDDGDPEKASRVGLASGSR